MELRDALRMLRSETGLTQSELAAAINVGYSAESRWENQNTRPNRASSAAILALAKQRRVSAVCLDGLTSILLASRADDKGDKALQEEVTERMKLEQRERLTSEQLKAVIDNLDLAVIGHRIDSTSPGNAAVFYYNKRYAEIFGYDETEFEQRSRENIYFAIPPESHAAYSKLLKRLLAGRIALSEFVITLSGQKKNGEAIWLEVKGVSLTQFSFGYELFISCRDITLRVETEKKYAEEVAVREASIQAARASLPVGKAEEERQSK